MSPASAPVMPQHPSPDPAARPGPVVDTASAQEFMAETLAKVPAAELSAIAADLQRKSAALQALLVGRRADQDELNLALRWVFSTRRRAARIVDSVGVDALADGVQDLLGSRHGVAERFDRFAALLAPVPEAAADLPAELLHFTAPDRYWLWTRWMWDPENETGALRLVVTEDVDLFGDSPGQAYLQVGQAVAFVDQTGKAAGFTDSGPGLFGVDVFLAAVYGVYMNTVLRMRMTQEFNRLVPELPQLIRRLLGVYHLEG